MHPPMPALAAEDVDADPARPLVVGYMSPDLFTHSVSYFAEAPLALHNPARRAGHGQRLCTCSMQCCLLGTPRLPCPAPPRHSVPACLDGLTWRRKRGLGQGCPAVASAEARLGPQGEAHRVQLRADGGCQDGAPARGCCGGRRCLA